MSNGHHRQSFPASGSIRHSIEHVYESRSGVRTKSSTTPNRCSERRVATRPSNKCLNQALVQGLPSVPCRLENRHRTARRTSPTPPGSPRGSSACSRTSRTASSTAATHRACVRSAPPVGPDQHLQRGPPAARAGGEGLPQARPQPPPGARGVPARGDGGAALDEPAPTTPPASTPPASATPPRGPPTCPLLGKIAAGGPILAEEVYERRLPAAQAAGGRGRSCSCWRSPASR